MKNKTEKGITLVALVVTIVVLLILAGVSIGTLFGDHGIIKKAQEAVDKTQEEVEKEQKEFENLLEQLNSLGNTEGGGDTPGKVEMPEGWDERQVTPVKSADNKIVPVPKGFTASEVSRTVGENEEIENTVDGGFVIYQNITDNDEDELNKVNNDNVDSSNARTTRSQFVWVPYSEFSSEKPMFTADGKGQLYDFISGGDRKGSEPDVVTSATSGSDSTSGSNYDAKPEYLEIVGLTGENATATKFKEQLTDEFNKMKASVEKYGGFYIGRYETGGLTGTAKVVDGENKASTSKQNWYIMYKKNKEIANGTSASSSLIWGCQWDACLNWFVSQGGKNALYVEGKYDNTSTDVVNNISNLTLGDTQYTLESVQPYGRIGRGGFYVGGYGDVNYASARDGSIPSSAFAGWHADTSSRATLIINLL